MIIAIQLNETEPYTNDEGVECVSVYSSYQGTIESPAIARKLFWEGDIILVDTETGKINKEASMEIEL